MHTRNHRPLVSRMFPSRSTIELVGLSANENMWPIVQKLLRILQQGQYSKNTKLGALLRAIAETPHLTNTKHITTIISKSPRKNDSLQ